MRLQLRGKRGRELFYWMKVCKLLLMESNGFLLIKFLAIHKLTYPSFAPNDLHH